jgi:hypothetical protein
MDYASVTLADALWACAPIEANLAISYETRQVRDIKTSLDQAPRGYQPGQRWSGRENIRRPRLTSRRSVAKRGGRQPLTFAVLPLEICGSAC